MPDQPITDRHPSTGIARAIIAGTIVVNGPVLVCILGSSFLGNALAGSVGAVGGLLLGAAVGWAWWAFTVPRWRAWALPRVTNPAKLHVWAVGFGIEWPKGSVFEKTEFRPRK